MHPQRSYKAKFVGPVFFFLHYFSESQKINESLFAVDFLGMITKVNMFKNNLEPEFLLFLYFGIWTDYIDLQTTAIVYLYLFQIKALIFIYILQRSIYILYIDYDMQKGRQNFCEIGCLPYLL